MKILRPKPIIFLFPLLLISIFLLMKISRPDIYDSMIQEDAAIEYMQAFLYLASSAIALLVSIRLLRNKTAAAGILYSLLAAALLLACLEELSWGQRIFHISSPAYFERHNWQREITIHNLAGMQSRLHGAYILVGAYGSFAWVLASLVFRRAKAGIRRFIEIVVPDWFISSYFFPTLFVYAAFEFYSEPYAGSFLVWRDQEPAELLLSLGFLAMMIAKLVQARRRSP